MDRTSSHGHVCGTLHDREYGVVVTVHNQIHLKIPKAFSVRLLGTRVNARSVGNGETLATFHRLVVRLDQIYLPDRVLLRLNSRESVDWLIPTIRAISFLGHFLWSKAKICDLCFEVSCLYIGNTKIINLRESSRGDSFFVLQVSLFGATCPGREATPRCFSWIRSYEKTNDLLHFDFESTSDQTI